MKFLYALLIVMFLSIEGCVITTPYGSASAENSFYLQMRDKCGNEVITTAHVEYRIGIIALQEMYADAVKELNKKVCHE